MELVQLMELCEKVFCQVKMVFCGYPLLHSPDYSFVMQTDTSDRRVGEGENCPVPYICHKLLHNQGVSGDQVGSNPPSTIDWTTPFTLCSDHITLVA